MASRSILMREKDVGLLQYFDVQDIRKTNSGVGQSPE